MTENHLKITAAGWSTFTGNFGGVEFANGISTAPVNRRLIDRVASLVQCDLTDKTGTPTVQAGLTARLVGMTSVPAEIGNGNNPTMRKATQEDLDADARQRAADAGAQPTQFYTKDQLNQIASKSGIAGIREIGDLWSVRDRSITKLIDLIVNAQGAFKARTASKNAQILAQRAQAAQDALNKNAAREVELEKKARLVTAGGLSNAIGPDGQNVVINATTVNIVTPVAPAPVEAAAAAPATTAAPAAPAAPTTPVTPPAAS